MDFNCSIQGVSVSKVCFLTNYKHFGFADKAKQLVMYSQKCLNFPLSPTTLLHIIELVEYTCRMLR